MVEHDLAKVGVASSSLVFRSKGQFSTDLFSCPDLSTVPRTRGPVLPPLEGRGGYKKARIHVADVGSSLVFRSKGQFSTDLFYALTIALFLGLAAPFSLLWRAGEDIKKARVHVADVGSSLVFRSREVIRNDGLFSYVSVSYAALTELRGCSGFSESWVCLR